VPCCVNVPSDHPLHAWAGKFLTGWMDSSGDENSAESSDKPGTDNFDPFDFPDLPKEREIELITVITDQAHFEAFKREAAKRRGYDPVKDNDELAMLFKVGANACAKQESKQMRAFQVREYLDAIIGRIALVKAKQTEEVNGAVVGRFKKDVNTRIKQLFGRSRDEMSEEELEDCSKMLKQELLSMKGLGL